MSNELSEMTLDELWTLFPIILSEHKDCWNEWYLDEAERIHAFLAIEDYRLSHIGSTAIFEIWAKPIIDLLLEIPYDISMETIKNSLISNGYICMCEQEGRKDFNKGYTNKGFAQRVFHLHLRYFGDNDELYFRDYMNDNPTLAKQYEELKLSLWKEFEHNRDAYTNAKGAFIKKQTQAAINTYGKKRYQR